MATHPALFRFGLARARELRRQLLESLGAEDEWILGGDDDETISWLAGPIETRFRVTYAADAVPAHSAQLFAGR